MRRDGPLVTKITDPDSGAQLSEVGYSDNRDMLGTFFRFTVSLDNQAIGVDAIVGDDTASIASKNAEREGVDYANLTVAEKLAYFARYKATRGALFIVHKFDVDGPVDEPTFVSLRAIFLRLLFKRNSSFRFNSEEEADSYGYYPDAVQFYPYGVDRRLCGMFTRNDV